MRAFILTCAARAARGDGAQHNSMLIHVTRFVDVQSQVAELVGFELRDLQNRIRYGDGESPTSIVAELRGMWLGDFVPSSRDVRRLYPDLMGGCQEVPWEDIHFAFGRILPEDSGQGDQRCGQGCPGLLGPPGGNECDSDWGRQTIPRSDPGGAIGELLPPRLANVRHPAADGQMVRLPAGLCGPVPPLHHRRAARFLQPHHNGDRGTQAGVRPDGRQGYEPQ